MSRLCWIVTHSVISIHYEMKMKIIYWGLFFIKLLYIVSSIVFSFVLELS